ncbi:MAG: glycosyltransferase family 4 protein [Planctomycetes bacterium]|nr:glycosyltransferase family 4 protein [Planctomycetota bacterium]
MKIFYLAHEIIPRGYISVHIKGVIKALTEKGHRVILMMPSWGRVRQFAPIEICYIPILDIKGLKFFLGVLSWPLYLFCKFILSPPDVVYVRGSPVFGLAVLVAKVFRIPVITEINGVSSFETTSISLSQKIVQLVSKILYSMVVKTSAILLPVTDKLKKWLIPTYHIPANRIKVIPNGVDEKLFYHIDKEEACLRVGLNPSNFYISFIGSFPYTQEIKTMIQAAPIVLEKIKNTRFIIVTGESGMLDVFQPMVNGLGLKEAFILVKSIPIDIARFWICASDICLNLPTICEPIIKNDVSSLKLYAYMACERPVITTDFPTDAGVVRESQCGLVIPPLAPDRLADAIITILDNNNLRQKMGRNGRQKVIKDFTWSRIAEQIEQILFQLVLSD